MIFFGKKASVLRSEQLFGKKCPHCSTAGTTEMHVIGEYAHVYWIPFFPMGKKGVSRCTQCKTTLEEKEMTTDLKAEYDLMRNEVKTPVWHFTGLGILAALMVLGYFAVQESDKNDLAYLNAPQVGDVYHYEIEPGSYSLMRVASVNGDTIGVHFNSMQINKISGLYKLNKPENFDTTSSVSILKSKLLELHEKGDLMSVNR
jgi:hypothetical protein